MFVPIPAWSCSQQVRQLLGLRQRQQRAQPLPAARTGGTQRFRAKFKASFPIKKSFVETSFSDLWIRSVCAAAANDVPRRLRQQDGLGGPRLRGRRLQRGRV